MKRGYCITYSGQDGIFFRSFGGDHLISILMLLETFVPSVKPIKCTLHVLQCYYYFQYVAERGDDGSETNNSLCSWTGGTRPAAKVKRPTNSEDTHYKLKSIIIDWKFRTGATRIQIMVV